MSRLTIIDRHAAQVPLAEAARAGLTASPKFLRPQYFYDALGSALFDAICQLAEYYPTRCETEVLTTYAREIVAEAGTPLRLVELGSGSARKTRLLLDTIVASQGELEYVMLDVDRSMLEKTARELLFEYPQLRITAVCADFSQPSGALEGVLGDRSARNLVLFLGSTIGNLTFTEATTMLRDLRSALAADDAFLLGADLRKEKATLEAAYDDPLGVTAAFNLNLLQRLNREAGANFPLHNFSHLAFFNDEESRIEMHLVSREAQRVRLGEVEIAFAEGETIHTENSYKYDDASLARITEPAGFRIARKWTDSRGWFADVLMRPR
jgi:dimethylhistidine N-methyltransferase